jgi:alpha-beta hydrolase superfamily lysophospholipase
MRWPALLVFVVATAVLTGCTTGAPQAPSQVLLPSRTVQPGFDGAATLPPPDMTDDGPGSLIDVKPLTDQFYLDEVDATAVRVVYRSTSGLNGPPTQVSGVVAVPPGAPPKGGWPIMAFGHDLTGVANKCAPSLAPDLYGYAAFMSVMLARGYVVAMTDYQGLGLGGSQHSLLDVATLGNNMIDVARAARHVLVTAGTRWAAFGAGEGGAASWAATERAGAYGGGLDLVGAVALSPLADLSGLALAAQSGTLTSDQYRLEVQVLNDLASTPGFNLDDFRAGLAKDRWDLLSDCAPADPVLAAQIYSQLKPADLMPHDPAAAAQLHNALADAALPLNAGTPTTAPLLVVYGTDDKLMSGAWIASALNRACARGDQIEVVAKIGDTTTQTDVVVQNALDWLQARLDGQKLATVCQGVV